METKSSHFSALSKILIQQKEYYPIIIIYSILIGLLTLAIPISVQSLVNTFTFGPFFQPIFILSLILFSLLIIVGLLRSLQYLVVEYLQRRIFAKIAANLSQAYFISNNKTHDIMDKENRFFDIIIIQKTLAYLVTDGVTMFLQTFLGLILISLYHPFFIVFGLLIVTCIFLPLYLLLAKGIFSAHEESTEKYIVAGFIAKIRSIKQQEISLEEKTEMIDSNILRFIKKRSAHFDTLFAQNIIYMVFYALLNALLLALGGYLVVSNQLTVGQLIAAEIVVNAILSNFLYSHKYLETFYDLSASARKLSVFYDFIEESKNSESQNGFSQYSTLEFHKKIKTIKKIYYPKNYLKIVKIFSASSFMVIFLLLITPWQQTSLGHGQVMALDPNDRVQAVTATLDGIVEEWLVQEGQRVKKGDSLVKIIDNDPNYLIRLESRRDAAVAKFEAAKAASDTGRINYHRQESLVKEGLSAPKEFELAKITYKKLIGEEASAAADLAKSEVDLSRQQLQDVVAPRDGQILRISLGSGTTNVKVGQELLQFVPDSSQNVVELFIDGNDLPLVYSGRSVRLQFEGWPSVQFSGWPSVAIGSFGGIVTAVDSSVSKDGTFRVLVKPDPNDSVAWPQQDILRQGSRAIGITLLDRVSIGYEVWRKVNGFPKSMSKPPMQNEKKSNL